MWPFEEPPLAEPATDYETACLERVRATKAVLDELDRQMLSFRTRYKVHTDRVGRLLAIESATLGGRPKIESEWQVLLRRRDATVAAWHEALHTWATAKETRERKEATP